MRWDTEYDIVEFSPFTFLWNSRFKLLLPDPQMCLWSAEQGVFIYVAVTITATSLRSLKTFKNISQTQFSFSSLFFFFWKHWCIWLLYLNIKLGITMFIHLQAISTYNIQFILILQMLTLPEENFTCPALKNWKNSLWHRQPVTELHQSQHNWQLMDLTCF